MLFSDNICCTKHFFGYPSRHLEADLVEWSFRDSSVDFMLVLFIINFIKLSQHFYNGR